MTDDERREVAAKLRELAQESARCGDDGVGKRACRVLLGPRIDLLDVVDAHFPLARLADLIEPEERTCHMRDASWDDGQCTWGCICSECGAKHEHERSGWMNFCPNCGAKVVEQ